MVDGLVNKKTFFLKYCYDTKIPLFLWLEYAYAQEGVCILCAQIQKPLSCS